MISLKVQINILVQKKSSRENTYFVGFLNPTHSYSKAGTKWIRMAVLLGDLQEKPKNLPFTNHQDLSMKMQSRVWVYIGAHKARCRRVQ
jgi:hypothetical protein